MGEGVTDMATLTGPVSAVRLNQNVAVTATGTPTTISTSPTAVHSTMTFRIGNRPVSMDGAVSLIDGDMVTAAGLDGNDFKVIALRNDTTRMVHTVPQPKAILALVFIALGVLTLWLMLIGIVFIVIGIGYWLNAQRKKQQIRDALAKLYAA
jgi:hypothetical protein